MTDLELQLKETYAERLDALDLSGGDVGAARSAGARMRTKRRLTVGVAALAVVAVGAAGTWLGAGHLPVGPAGHTGQWRELPAAPLSPRADALSVWTGSEVVVVGGQANPCPPNADCATAEQDLRDGAAYNPTSNSWRRVPPAPVPVGPGDRLLAADGVVVLRHWQQHGSRWFTYEPDHNRWSRIDDVPARVGDLPSAYGSKVYVTAGRRVTAYDVRSFRWTITPPDKLEPALSQRRVTATDVGPVVTGLDSTQPNDGRAPSVVLADVWDGNAWHRLPATGQLGNDFFWTGARMVDPDPTTVDGGEVDPFPHPYPSGGILDPATGAWTQLPVEASGSSDGWGVNAQGGRWSATYGQVYDTVTGVVTTLSRPAGAPGDGVSAAWADGRLLAFGGADYGSDGAEPTNHAWLYMP